MTLENRCFGSRIKRNIFKASKLTRAIALPHHGILRERRLHHSIESQRVLEKVQCFCITVTVSETGLSASQLRES